MDKGAVQRLVDEFLAALSSAELPESVFAGDLSVWTVSSKTTVDRNRFAAALKLLRATAKAPFEYRAIAVTAEDDRIVIETESKAVLVTDEAYANQHVFLLRINAGRIASIVEFMDPVLVREKLAPLMQQAMARASE